MSDNNLTRFKNTPKNAVKRASSETRKLKGDNDLEKVPFQSLKFGSQIFEVGTMEKLIVNVGEVEGATDVELMLVAVDTRYPKRRCAETLIHEILHAMLWEAGLDWNSPDAETWIRRISPRLAAFFTDNQEAAHALVSMFADE